MPSTLGEEDTPGTWTKTFCPSIIDNDTGKEPGPPYKNGQRKLFQPFEMFKEKKKHIHTEH